MGSQTENHWPTQQPSGEAACPFGPQEPGQSRLGARTGRERHPGDPAPQATRSGWRSRRLRRAPCQGTRSCPPRSVAGRPLPAATSPTDRWGSLGLRRVLGEALSEWNQLRRAGARARAGGRRGVAPPWPLLPINEEGSASAPAPHPPGGGAREPGSLPA